MSSMPDKNQILTALQKGDIDLQGQFLNGSNYTFMARLAYETQDVSIVYKPVRGEQPLWDFPNGTLAKREVAAYAISEALGWELVPPTVYRRKGPLGAGSVQLYIEHDPEYHFFNFNDKDKQRLRPMAVFDLLVNNADRKGSHILMDANDHIWVIDHGLCFHEEDKLRTVVWDFGGQEIPLPLLDCLQKLHGQLQGKNDLTVQLLMLLQQNEVNALDRRARRLLDNRRFPHPGSGHRPYPWPPI
ncbi:MAG: SCO1664 family protein [Anaerolineaceae bacterium]|nr:SCO1664 family protein [Anaerolineaceae bacterium]